MKTIPGLRAAKTLITARRKELAKEFPHSTDPHIRGERHGLKALLDIINVEIDRIKAAI